MSSALGIDVRVAEDLDLAFHASDICVTCTPSRKPILRQGAVGAGTFIAAVGADNESKQELEPALMAASVVVVDMLEQAATIGDLHHAIACGALTPGDVRAELGQIIAGRRPGRQSDDEIVIFDSTGVALEDVAAAAAAYERAVRAGRGLQVDLAA